MLGSLLTAIFVFVICVFISGCLLSLGTNSNLMAKGWMAMEACAYIVIAYMAFMKVYQSGTTLDGIPFSGCINSYESMTKLMVDAPVTFAYNVAQLFTVTLIMGFIVKIIPSYIGGRNLIGKILLKILLVFIALIINHYVVSWAIDQPIWGNFVYFLTCFFGLTVAVMTPTMLITQIITSFTGLAAAAPVVVFLAKVLPESGIGRAMKTAFVSSMVFLFFLFIADSYFGSLAGAATPVVELLMEMGSTIIMVAFLLMLFSHIIHR